MKIFKSKTQFEEILLEEQMNWTLEQMFKDMNRSYKENMDTFEKIYDFEKEEDYKVEAFKRLIGTYNNLINERKEVAKEVLEMIKNEYLIPIEEIVIKREDEREKNMRETQMICEEVFLERKEYEK